MYQCAICHENIRIDQTYFLVHPRRDKRFHERCYKLAKPRDIMKITGAMMPVVTMHNDKED